MLRPTIIPETLATRLSQAPLRAPSAADESPYPPRYDSLAYAGYPMLPSTIVPAFATAAGYPFLRGSSRLALLSSIGLPCCEFAAAGCFCRCSGGIGSLSSSGFSYDGYRGYGMVDTDWPGIDWMIGVGPGPYLEYPEVFPLHGRTNLAPNRGY